MGSKDFCFTVYNWVKSVYFVGSNGKQVFAGVNNKNGGGIGGSRVLIGNTGEEIEVVIFNLKARNFIGIQGVFKQTFLKGVVSG